MSAEFDVEWLRLRAPFDSAARSSRLEEQAAALLAARARLTGKGVVRIVDLGAGTGANFRHLAPRLDRAFADAGLHLDQDWRLVDRSDDLLSHLESEMIAWAREGGRTLEGNGLTSVAAARGEAGRWRFSMRRADLAALDWAQVAGDADLITASALIDLAGEDWLRALMAAAVAADAPLLIALSYDGRLSWSPQGSLDQRVLAAFERHQCRDKGLGPALGPAAGERLETLARSRGWRVWADDSDWLVAADSAAMQNAMIDAIARAVAETERDAPAPGGLVPRWLAERRALTPAALIVGHRDVLAWRG